MAEVDRVGLGYDLHRLAAGRRLVLAGVAIEWPEGLVGHSDADGAVLTRQAVGMVRRAGWRVVNADVTIRAERPKLLPYKRAMRDTIAKLLGVGSGEVNVKAKTDEGTGPVGCGEAMAAMAVVGLAKLSP